MSKAILVYLIYASVATFRRAGLGFTDKGSAFSINHFTDEQLKAIHAEPRLSLKKVPIDAIPEGVDTSAIDMESLAAAQLASEKEAEEKAAAEKAKRAEADKLAKEQADKKAAEDAAANKAAEEAKKTASNSRTAKK